MATTIQNALKSYMAQLLQAYDALGDERTRLQAAATRLPAIDVEQAAILAEAQAQLVKYNTQHGTSLTLAQLRAILFGA